MRADFLRRCQNLLSFVKAIIVVGEKPEIVIKWSTPSIVQFVSVYSEFDQNNIVQ